MLEIASQQIEQVISWRRQLHRIPETAFCEHQTAQFIAQKLRDMGIEPETGFAGTGVIGTLRRGRSARSILLRAELDALPIAERNELSYRSLNAENSHACGHDGHMAMLLGAAKILAERNRFDGTVYFLFQPAEENEGGAKRVLEHALFQKFPADAIYGMHNWPGLPLGMFSLCSGPMMASFDRFEITLKSEGGHAAMPHLCADTITASAYAITALQTVISRMLDPVKSGVLSVTQIQGGDTWNVIPEQVILRGSVRTLSGESQKLIPLAMEKVLNGVASTFSVRYTLDMYQDYPILINSPKETEMAIAVAESIANPDCVCQNQSPVMASEDFAFFLREKPGSYIFIGAGLDSPRLHQPDYDFNDEIIPLGLRYWIALVEKCLLCL
ncbi:M20 aminoacylase family protein [Magnetococcales bacterium HHB-1]